MRDLENLGLRFDTAAKASRIQHVSGQDLVRFMLQPIPPAVDNSALEGPILDQNQTGSCTGHGTSQWLQVSYQHQGRPLPFRPSPKGIYDCTRELDRKSTTPPGQPLPPLTDSGGMPSDIVIALATMGIRPLVMPSPQGFASDIDTSNVNVEESLGQLELDAEELLGSARRIDPAQPGFTTSLMAAIAQTGAVGLAIFVDTAFERWNPSMGPMQTCDTNDPNGGGHWVSLNKYTTQPDGSVVFQGPNSWTAQWGMGGRFQVTDTWLAQSANVAYAIFLPAVRS